MIDRRGFALGAGALAIAGCAKPVAHGRERAERFDGPARLAAIEAAASGRLGVFVLDTASGRGFGWRAGERFGMCSTFKLSLAAFALREIDAGRLDPAEVLPYSAADLLPVSPVTAANVATRGMPVLALAAAALITSDNTAANLLLHRLGGPPAMTRFWRELGDPVSRLDNTEPLLNRVRPGEVHDTTSPEAMAHSIARFVTGDVLSGGSRTRLVDLMEQTRTGLSRLRGALPAGWRAGDKTGTGLHAGIANKVNDFAVFYPPARAPMVVTALYEAPGYYDTIRPQDEAVLRRVGEVAAAWLPAA